MRKKTIDAIVKDAERLALAAESLSVALSEFVDSNAQPFNVRQTVRGTDSTTSDILARIQSVIGLVDIFEKAKSPELVPAILLAELSGALTATAAAADAIVAQIVNINSSQGGLGSFTYKTFVAQAQNGNATNMDGLFQTIYSSTETLLEKFFNTLHIIKPRGSLSFQAASNALARSIDSANEKLATLNASLKQVAVTEDNLKEKETSAASSVEKIAKLLSAGETDRQTIAEYLAQATTQQAAVQTVHDQAKVLEDSVKSYQSDFDNFQRKLDGRESLLSTSTNKLNELVSEFAEFRSTVENTIERSEQMLSSSTVAGLASNFNDMKDNLTRELRWARFSFYFSIGLLMVSAIPLFAIVAMPFLAPILKHFFPDMPIPDSQPQVSVGTEWQYLAQVIGRIVILLPAAWLVSFTAIRHSSLFRLREHYAYKYSMAISVEGFKKQAPDYAQQIAALVLEELAFNPADKLIPSKEIKEGKAPLLAGYLLDKLKNGDLPLRNKAG